jgi:uncharacterized protein with PIN domain
MPCEQCGGVLEPVDIPEHSGEGRFQETWKCVNCGANGYVSGKEQDPPTKWNHYGAAYE